MMTRETESSILKKIHRFSSSKVPLVCKLNKFESMANEIDLSNMLLQTFKISDWKFISDQLDTYESRLLEKYTGHYIASFENKVNEPYPNSFVEKFKQTGLVKFEFRKKINSTDKIFNCNVRLRPYCEIEDL